MSDFKIKPEMLKLKYQDKKKNNRDTEIPTTTIIISVRIGMNSATAHKCPL